MDSIWWLYSPVDNLTFTYTFVADWPGDPAVSGNVNITEDGYCFGQIKGDPDVAGWGVFGGFVLNAAIAISVSFWYMWVPFARTKWKQARSPTSYGGQRQNGEQQIAPIEEPERELTPVESLVLALGDTNLVSGLAIIISSMIKLSQDPAYPLYHLFLARSLAALALVGHNTAAFVYAKLRRYHPYSLYVRCAVSFATMILYLTWSGLALERFRLFEQQPWPGFTPLCFSTHRCRVGGTFRFWIRMNMFWVPQSFAWVLLNPFKLIDSVEHALDYVDGFIISLIKGVFTKYWSNLVPSNSATYPMWKFMGVISWSITRAMVKTFGVMILVLLSSIFFPTDALLPISNILLGLVWPIYDVVTVKLSNQHAVVDALETPVSQAPQNPEQDFGIGQIFPLLMGLQLVMAFLDACSGRIRRMASSGPSLMNFKLGHLNKKAKSSSLSSSALDSVSRIGPELHISSSAQPLTSTTVIQRKALPEQIEPAHVH